MIGDCDVGDGLIRGADICVSSKNYPDGHGNRGSCRITMLRDAYVTPGRIFNVEAGFDELVIGGNNVESVEMIPSNLSVGEVISWRANDSFTNEGWQLCFLQPLNPTVHVTMSGS